MQKTTNLYGLLDQAMPEALAALKEQGVGPLGRAVLGVRVRHSEKVRDQIVAELATRLADDPEFEKACPDCFTLFSQEGYMLAKPFSIDVDKLAQILELLLKYLPLILKLFM